MPTLLPDRIENFLTWLDLELADRQITDSELARRGGISHAAISRARHGQLPGWEACKGIARGLNLPPEIVLRAAGHLPAFPEMDPVKAEMIMILDMADENQKKEILHYARFIHSGSG